VKRIGAAGQELLGVGLYDRSTSGRGAEKEDSKKKKTTRRKGIKKSR